MIILDSQATKLQAKLAADGTLVNFFGVYADSGVAFTPGQNNVASNGMTYVDVVSAPQSGQRQVKSVYAYNGDSVAHTITFAHYDGTTTRNLNIVTLAPGAAIDLIPGRGLYGAITGPTDSTLAQTGMTLSLNLANPNSWGALQAFDAGIEAKWPPYGDYAGWTLYYKQNRSNPSYSSLNFDVTPGGQPPGVQTSVLKLTGVEIDTTVPIRYFDGTAYYPFLTQLDATDFMPAVAPGPSGNVLTSDGTDWTSAAPPAGADDTLATVTARGATTSVPSSFTGGLSASAVSTGSLNVQTPTSSAVGAIIKGTSGQTADLLQIQDSTGAKLVTVTKDGRLAVGGASPTSYDFQGAGHGIHLNGGPIYGFSSLNSGSVNPSYLYGLQDVGWDDTIPYDILKLRKFKAGGSTQNYISAYLNGGGNGVDGANIFNLNYQGILSFANTGALVFSSTSSAVGALDIGIARASAGVLKVTDGSSGDGTITAKSFRLKGYTVATLPAGTQGDTAYVTDAVSPTYLGTLTGGGTVVTPVFYNGTAWVAY